LIICRTLGFQERTYFKELMDISNILESTVSKFFEVVLKYHLRFYLTTEDFVFMTLGVKTIINFWHSVSLCLLRASSDHVKLTPFHPSS